MNESMKKSGIEWIGEIPESWSINKIKYLAILKGRIGWQGLTSEEYQDDGAYLITGTDFLNGTINWESCVRIPESRWEEAKDIQIENGDLLITKDGTVGKVAIVEQIPGKTSLNSGVLRISTYPEYDRKFLFWVLQSSVFWGWFNYRNAGNSTIIHLYQKDFGEFKYAYPSFRMQQEIAKHLDIKCLEISNVISTLERQIELLLEYKKSLVTETVTKGLNPDALMKDSGIEWIGEIPEHWEVKKIKHIAAYIGSGTTPDTGTTEYYDGAINWIQSGDLYKTSKVTNTEKTVTDLALNAFGTLKVYKQPFIVLAMYGASVGNVAISQIDACVNQACCVIIPNGYQYIDFLYYWLVTCKQDFDTKAIGGGQPNISQQIIKNQYYLDAPREEQQAIASFLNQRCAEIDSIINDKPKQIEVQKEYKQSLIYEYVTGKKRVKGVN